MGKYALPLGFRFHPTDVELVKYYLKRKLLGKKFSFEAIAEVDIYKYAPWDLPDFSCLKTGDLKWYFFCPIEKKFAKGGRMNRATVYGFWKATGKDRAVKYNEETVGMIKTLVFHQGKAPSGSRTDWVMHEYRLEEKELADKGVVQDSYVLCVVFKKEGLGPQNGAQYGAPFKEEDWSDSEDTGLVETGFLSGISTLGSGGASSSYVSRSVCAEPYMGSTGLHTAVPPTTINATASTITSDIDNDALPLMVTTDGNSVSTCPDPDGTSVPTCLNDPVAPDHSLVLDSNVDPAMEASQIVEGSNDDIVTMLDIFTEEDINGSSQMTGNSNFPNFETPQFSDEDDILAMLASFSEDPNSNNPFI